jgi:hypothetical protein
LAYNLISFVNNVINLKITYYLEILPQHRTKGSPVFFGGHEQVAVPFTLVHTAPRPHTLGKLSQGSF